jgi:uncharacterized protein (TIGR04222 family)
MDGSYALLGSTQLYAVLCVAVVGAMWLRRRSLLGAGDDAPLPHDLDAYEVAVLNGGPQLAITIAAAELHRRASLVRSGRQIVARRPPGTGAGNGSDLEHEVFEAVQRNPGTSPRQLRRRLAGSPAIARIESDLTDAGLLLRAAQRTEIRWLWLWAVAPLALGAQGVVAAMNAGESVTEPGALLVGLALATLWVTGGRARPTTRGIELLERERGGRSTPAHVPDQADVPMAVAVYGAGALWLANPAIASAWSAGRDGSSRWSGTGGTGAGWGGGGWSGGDWGGGGGGGDGGGGGCGGGGG